MSIADVTRLRALRDKLAEYSWSHSGALKAVRFFSELGGQTNEKYLQEEEHREIAQFLQRTEYSGASITWSWDEAVGSTLKQIVLGKFDEKIQEVAEQAKAEAEGVLELLSDPDFEVRPPAEQEEKADGTV